MQETSSNHILECSRLSPEEHLTCWHFCLLCALFCLFLIRTFQHFWPTSGGNIKGEINPPGGLCNIWRWLFLSLLRIPHTLTFTYFTLADLYELDFFKIRFKFLIYILSFPPPVSAVSVCSLWLSSFFLLFILSYPALDWKRWSLIDFIPSLKAFVHILLWLHLYFIFLEIW